MRTKGGLCHSESKTSYCHEVVELDVLVILI